jgi:tRNA (guanine37-N1)-methyltransferase
MRIDILTLFPHMFDGFLTESIIKRAIQKECAKINIIDIRDYTPYKNNQVDDYAFGGGAGMIMMCEPVFNAVDSIKTKDSYIVLLSPRGKTFIQNNAYKLSDKKHIIIICGHYEGFDERIYSLADEVISIGDFVLTGGELPSMMITDSIVRLLDGVISKESLETESFNDNLLDYPVYTKPRVFKNMEVPEVLLSGDHKRINEYREEMRKKITEDYRKDIMK